MKVYLFPYKILIFLTRGLFRLIDYLQHGGASCYVFLESKQFMISHSPQKNITSITMPLLIPAQVAFQKIFFAFFFLFALPLRVCLKSMSGIQTLPCAFTQISSDMCVS